LDTVLILAIENFVCGFVVLYLIFIVVYGMLLRCTQFVYVVKYYSTENLYTVKLDLFYIWRLYRQIWISGTNKGDQANGTALCIQKGHNTSIASRAVQD
jgi:hypothetical protein